MTTRSSFIKALNALLVFSVTYLFIHGFLDQANFDIFQSRDIIRTLEFLKGNIIFYGPEMTNGGHLTGPATYLLYMPPLFFFGSWKACLIWTALLCAFSKAVLWVEIRRRNGLYPAYLCILIYLSGSLGPYVTLYNLHPVFLLFFSPLILCCYFRIFYEGQDRLLPIAFLLIGLSLQVHLTSIIWIILFVVSTIFSRPFGHQRPSLKYCLVGILVMLSLQVPYLWWYFFGTEKNAIVNLYHSGAFNNIALMWFDFWNAAEKMNFTRSSKTLVLMDFIKENPHYLFLTVQVPIIFVLRYYNRAKIHLDRRSVSFLFLSCGLLLLFLLSEIDYTPRYVIIANLLLSMSLGLFLCDAIGTNRAAKVFYLIIVGLFFIHFTYGKVRLLQDPPSPFTNHDYGKTINCAADYQPARPQNRAKTLGQLSELIISLTGWDYEYFQLHTYILEGVNFGVNFGFKPIYAEIYDSTKKNSLPSLNVPKGLLLTKTDFLKCGNPLTSEEALALMREHLPTPLKDAFHTGAIYTKDIYALDGIVVMPYYSLDPNFDLHVQNFGLAYEELVTLERPALGRVKETARVGSQLVFKWNDCPERQNFCDSYLIMDQAKVTVLGDVMTVREISFSPEGIISYKGLTLDMTCGQKTHNVPIISESIGSPMTSEVFVLTPLVRQIKLPCKWTDISEISLHIGEGLLFRAVRFEKVKIPPRKISFKVI